MFSADGVEESALPPFTQLRRRWHHPWRSALSNECQDSGVDRFLSIPVTCRLLPIGKFEVKGGGKPTVPTVTVNRRSEIVPSCLFKLATFGHSSLNATLPVEFKDGLLD